MIWLASVLFVLLQFFLHLSSGVIIGAIMQDMKLSAVMAGLLGSSMYLIYTIFQIPVGLLFDKKNTRTLMTINALITSVGCFVFASSHSLTGLFIGRLLIGAGSSFSFVGYSHVLREQFSLKHFALLMGLSETLAFTVTMLGMISMGKLLTLLGWRVFIVVTGFIGFIITFLCWYYIPDSPKNSESSMNYKKQFLIILSSSQAWINGISVGLSFAVVTVFGALWAVPFIQVKLNSTLGIASIIGSFFFLGAAISCPLFGHLSNLLSRRTLIIVSCATTSFLIFVFMFFPTTSHVMIGFLMFAIGLCCGAYMLAFSIANELAPKGCLSLCTGFTNTLATLTAPLLQLLIGIILDVSSSDKNYSLYDYQLALLVIPIGLLIAGYLARYLPSKAHQ